jgi:hypothetical protein
MWLCTCRYLLRSRLPIKNVFPIHSSHFPVGWQVQCH